MPNEPPPRKSAISRPNNTLGFTSDLQIIPASGYRCSGDCVSQGTIVKMDVARGRTILAVIEPSGHSPDSSGRTLARASLGGGLSDPDLSIAGKCANPP